MGTSQEIFARRLSNLVGAGRPFESGNALAAALKQHQRTINRYIKLESVPTLTALDEIALSLGMTPIDLINPGLANDLPAISDELMKAFALLRRLDAETLAKATQVIEVLGGTIPEGKALPDETDRNILYKHTVNQGLEDIDPVVESGKTDGSQRKRGSRSS